MDMNIAASILAVAMIDQDETTGAEDDGRLE